MTGGGDGNTEGRGRETGRPTPLADRFAKHWRAEGLPGPGSRVAVACSGGLDSLVLLHLLRFHAAALDLCLTVAHFDHRMRPDSEKDAAWLRGLSGAWRIPYREEGAVDPPAGEAAARVLRYGFLGGLLRADEVDAVVTAHHADDQVETVLFRLLRGTGVKGLRGIPVSRRPGIFRPLLPFRRAELEAYAEDQGLRPRLDPTNLSLRFARNRVRHRLLPLLEEIHPGAREGVLRAARNARRMAEALELLLEPHLDRVAVSRREGGRSSADIELDRARLLEYPEALRGELLRAAAGGVGIRLSETGTALAVQFINEGVRGSRLDLGGHVRIHRDEGRIRLTRSAEEGSRFRRIVFDRDTIAIRVAELGAEITRHYDEVDPRRDPILVLGLLKGSFIFLADLVRSIDRPLHVDFAVAASYGGGRISSGDVKFLHDPDVDIGGRHVLLVEDIIDSGNTVSRVVPMLEDREPKSLEICTLLHKRRVTLEKEPVWVGFDAPDEFLVGYGLDHAEDFRHLPFVAAL